MLRYTSLCLLFILLLPAAAGAQISLEHKYHGSDGGFWTIKGDQYVFFNNYSTVNVFDASHNLVRSFKQRSVDIYYNVFDADPNTFEFVVWDTTGDHTTANGQTLVDSVSVVDENGKVLLEKKYVSPGNERYGVKLINGSWKYILNGFDTDTTYVYDLPGTATNKKEARVQLPGTKPGYPNPAREQFTIPVPAQGQSQVTLRNLQGQTVHQSQVRPGRRNYKLNVRQLPAGTYFYSVDGQGARKLIVR
jgi:hypothetical protein